MPEIVPYGLDRLPPSFDEALSRDTLVDCLLPRQARPEIEAFNFETLDAPPDRVSAGRLFEEAGRIARGLEGLGVERNGRVMVVLPTSPDFVFSFWGTLLGGATPVPAYPPAGLAQLEGFLQSLLRMLQASEAKVVIVPEILRDVMLAPNEHSIAGARIVTPDDVRAAAVDGPLPEPPSADDLALIQFSSGSTGEPRGVCLTHRNVLSNVRAFLARISVKPGDSCVTWLPLYHDMGLIGTLLGPMILEAPLTLIPPTDFLRRPAFWLQSIGRNRGSVSVAPQFAFNLCVRKVKPADLADIDLSCLKVLLNGAEPIREDGVRAFEEHLKPFGLRPGVVRPCYGLAEGTLAASMARTGAARRIERPIGADATASDVMSVGAPMNGVEIQILGPNGAVLADGEVGEIQIRGDSVCKGLLSGGEIRPAVSASGWLPTRDLGFLHGGELFITGRIKDLIIIGGRNLYPQDLEEAAGELPGFRPGRVAAFGVTVPGLATEALVVVAETSDDAGAAAEAAAALRQSLLRRFGVIPHDTVLLRHGHIPRTTSGKLRRAQARADYESGELKEVVYRARPTPIGSASV